MRIGWFSTGRGEGSRGLLTAALRAIDEGRLDARIEFVFCNRDRGQHEGTDRFLDTVEARGIPLVTLSSQAFRRAHGRRPWAELRGAFDRAAIEKLGGLSADVSVGAGYMLLAPVLCRHYTMINLHPALPDGPVGTWQDVTWELIDSRARESGVMVHIMVEEMDAGPVITCCRFPLSGSAFDPGWQSLGNRTSADVKAQAGEDHPLFVAIRSEALVRERPFLVETLRAVHAGRIDLKHPGASGPLDLTPEVDALLCTTG